MLHNLLLCARFFVFLYMYVCMWILKQILKKKKSASKFVGVVEILHAYTQPHTCRHTLTDRNIYEGNCIISFFSLYGTKRKTLNITTIVTANWVVDRRILTGIPLFLTVLICVAVGVCMYEYACRCKVGYEII